MEPTVVNFNKSRVTIIEKIVHQSQGSPPYEFGVATFRELESDESIYQKRFEVGEQWTTLNLGWVEVVSLLMLRNEEGKFTQIMPTPQEKLESLSRIVELRQVNSSCIWLIHPQDVFRGCPIQQPDLQIRCQTGIAKITLLVIPK